MPDPTPLERVAQRARERDALKAQIEKIRKLEQLLPSLAEKLARNMLAQLSSDEAYIDLQDFMSEMEGDTYNLDDDLIENDETEEHYARMVWERAYLMLGRFIYDTNQGIIPVLPTRN